MCKRYSKDLKNEYKIEIPNLNGQMLHGAPISFSRSLISFGVTLHILQACDDALSVNKFHAFASIIMKIEICLN